MLTKLAKLLLVALVIIYLLSFLSLAATIVRLVKVVQYAQRDDQWDAIVLRFDYTYFAVIEIMTAILCANLPTMSSLLRHISSSKATQSNHGYGSSGVDGMDLRKANSGTSFVHRWFKSSIRSINLVTSRDTEKQASTNISREGPFSRTNLTEEKKSTSSASVVGYGNGDTYAEEITYTTPVVMSKEGKESDHNLMTKTFSRSNYRDVSDAGDAAGYNDDITNAGGSAATQACQPLAATAMRIFPPTTSAITTIGTVQNGRKDSQTVMGENSSNGLIASLSGGHGRVRDRAIYRTDGFDVERSAI